MATIPPAAAPAVVTIELDALLTRAQDLPSLLKVLPSVQSHFDIPGPVNTHACSQPPLSISQLSTGLQENPERSYPSEQEQLDFPGPS